MLKVKGGGGEEIESLCLLFDNVQVLLRILGPAVKHAYSHSATAATSTLAAVAGLAALKRGAVCRDKMLAEVPLVLHHLLADGAGHALGLHVHVDNVLFKVEAVGEGLPAVVADTWLHAAPPVARVGDSCGRAAARCRQLLLLLASWQLLL